MAESVAETNGNHAREARIQGNKRRGVKLGMRRVPRGRSKVRGGDDPKTRDKGRGQ